jgi:hypothetical protein
VADPLETESILNSVKRSLDVAPEDTSFDTVLIIHINTVISDLYQIGLGQYGTDQITITDANDTWETAFGSMKNIDMIKSYVYLRLRLLHDPPQAGYTTASFQSQIDKMEWRIRLATHRDPNSSEI